jgi:hypothetical protein
MTNSSCDSVPEVDRRNVTIYQLGELAASLWQPIPTLTFQNCPKNLTRNGTGKGSTPQSRKSKSRTGTHRGGWSRGGMSTEPFAKWVPCSGHATIVEYGSTIHKCRMNVLIDNGPAYVGLCCFVGWASNVAVKRNAPGIGAFAHRRKGGSNLPLGSGSFVGLLRVPCLTCRRDRFRHIVLYCGDTPKIREDRLKVFIGHVLERRPRHRWKKVPSLAHSFPGPNRGNEVLLCPVTKSRLLVGREISGEAHPPRTRPGGKARGEGAHPGAGGGDR